MRARSDHSGREHTTKLRILTEYLNSTIIACTVTSCNLPLEPCRLPVSKYVHAQMLTDLMSLESIKLIIVDTARKFLWDLKDWCIG